MEKDIKYGVPVEEIEANKSFVGNIKTPHRLGKIHKLSFSVDKDGRYSIDGLEISETDHIAVIAMALLLLEEVWETQYKLLYSGKLAYSEKERLNDSHAWDIARIEKARVWLNSKI